MLCSEILTLPSALPIQSILSAVKLRFKKTHSASYLEQVLTIWVIGTFCKSHPSRGLGFWNWRKRLVRVKLWSKGCSNVCNLFDWRSWSCCFLEIIISNCKCNCSDYQMLQVASQMYKMVPEKLQFFRVYSDYRFCHVRFKV